MAANRPNARAGQAVARRWRLAAAGTLLLVAAAIAYSNSFTVPFLMDDDGAVLENPSIRNLGDLPAVLWPPDGTTTAGRPLLNLSFALNHVIGGTAVGGYHAVNLLIHALAGLALFGVLRRILPLADGKVRECASAIAFVAALWWTLHPLQTASVTYVSQRAESLMGLCYLLTVYCFLRGAVSADGSGSRKGWFLGSILACVLGALVKEPIATAPLLVLLCDRAFLSGSFREALRKRRGLYAGLAASWLVLAGLMAGASLEARGVGTMAGVSPWTYALTEFQVVLRYLGLTVWPHPLVFDYGPGLIIRDPMRAMPWALGVGALLSGVAWFWTRNPRAAFPGIAFFLLLAPTSTVVPVALQPMAESRLYLPLAAVVSIAAVLLARLGRRRLFAGGCAVALLLLVLTHERNATYATERGLWEDTIAKEEGNWRAHYSLALVLMVEPGLGAEAIRQFETALALKPDLADAHSNVAALLLMQPDGAAAAADRAESALRIDPSNAGAHYNLHLALSMMPGRGEEALRHLEESVRLDPDEAEARFRLAIIRLSDPSRLEEAIEHFAAAVRLDPGAAEYRNNYAGALYRAGRVAEAIRELEAALTIDPGYADARANLDRLRGAAGPGAPGR
jgi:tetratricopeptide (TPR) repeat protein